MNDFAAAPQTIIDFWREAGEGAWYTRNQAFDETIALRFGDLYERAATGGLDDWADDPSGALALVILLDQFPRNMFRGEAKAFATDDKALAIAKAALARGDHETVAEDLNAFLAMPLMHSERAGDQDDAVAWMEKIGNEANVKSAHEHRDIIARFGRFPHRNPVLGRATVEEERTFLLNGGFAG